MKPCNLCNPYHETERIQDRFGAVVYREKPCRYPAHTRTFWPLP